MSSKISQSFSRPLLQTYLRLKGNRNVILQKNIKTWNNSQQQCSRSVVTLNIEPKVSLVDDRIQTFITGLKPNEKSKHEVKFPYRIISWFYLLLFCCNKS